MGAGSWQAAARLLSLRTEGDGLLAPQASVAPPRLHDFAGLLCARLAACGCSGQVAEWLRESTGCARAIATNQGRVGLHAAVKAVVRGERNRVILSPYTLYEVVNMVVYAGGQPVFVDTQPDTPFITASKVESLMDSHTAAVMGSK